MAGRRLGAGLPEGSTHHDLRHLHASLLIDHGESVKLVQRRLGHASDRDAGQVLAPVADSEDRTRAAVGSVLRVAHVWSEREAE